MYQDTHFSQYLVFKTQYGISSLLVSLKQVLEKLQKPLVTSALGLTESKYIQFRMIYMRSIMQGFFRKCAFDSPELIFTYSYKVGDTTGVWSKGKKADMYLNIIK